MTHRRYLDGTRHLDCDVALSVLQVYFCVSRLDAAVADHADAWSIAYPFASIILPLLSFSVGVKFARLIVANREEVLANIVPLEVAQALVEKHNRMQDRSQWEKKSLLSRRGSGEIGMTKRASGELAVAARAMKPSASKASAVPSRQMAESINRLRSCLARLVLLQSAKEKRTSDVGCVVDDNAVLYGKGVLRMSEGDRLEPERACVCLVRPESYTRAGGAECAHSYTEESGACAGVCRHLQRTDLMEELAYFRKFDDISMVFSDLVSAES